MSRKVRVLLIQAVVDQLDPEGRIVGQNTTERINVFEADFQKFPEFVTYLNSRGLSTLLETEPPAASPQGVLGEQPPEPTPIHRSRRAR